MNKIITLYELLGLIINKELKENTLIKMSYKDGSVDNYCRYKDGKFVVYYDEGKTKTDGCLDIINYLKHHDSFIVEILDDEDMEIEELPNNFHYTGAEEELASKINELVREINKLKKEGK